LLDYVTLQTDPIKIKGETFCFNNSYSFSLKTFRYIVLFLPFIASAQNYTLNGYVKDAESGENLIGATVIDLNTQKGAITNAYGFFSLTLRVD